jgi:NTE family protein
MIWESLSTRRSPAPVSSVSGVSPLALALQGGGAYGAYAWGVLDRLLQERELSLAGFSGASAGAINAVVAASGWLAGGAQGARDALSRLWAGVGQMSLFSPLGLPGASLQFDLMTRVLSPYQFNPLNINPLRDLLASLVDFEALRGRGRLPLFISATNVRTGAQRVFREHEMTVDVLMASTCIPYVSQAVEIEGEAYWDGGFSSNPPILPPVLESGCRALLLVKLTPDVEPDLPTAAPDIFARLKRIMFNAPLLRDLEALAEMQRLLKRTNLLPSDLRRLRDLTLYQLAIEPEFFAPANGSALDPHPELLTRLFDAGGASAEAMLRRWRLEPEALRSNRAGGQPKS